MKSKLKRNLIIAGIILAVIVVAYFVYINGAQVSATGISTIKAQPDLISIYVTIESRHLSSQVAQESVNTISENLIGELKEYGLEDTDMQLVNYNVYPEYDWISGSQKIKDYVANQQMIVKVETFSKITYIIDTVARADALISGINYELSTAKQNEYKAQALNEASKDAKIKASSVAAGFGRSLGRLVSVQSQEFNYYPYPLYARAESSTGNSDAVKSVSSLSSGISPTDIEVSASVSAIYTITRF